MLARSVEFFRARLPGGGGGQPARATGGEGDGDEDATMAAYLAEVEAQIAAEARQEADRVLDRGKLKVGPLDSFVVHHHVPRSARGTLRLVDRPPSHTVPSHTVPSHTVQDKKGQRVRGSGGWIGVWKVGDKFYGLSTKCPHAGADFTRGPVRKLRGRQTVMCPAHNMVLDLETGGGVYDPGKGVRVHAVSIENGDVYVADRGRIVFKKSKL